MRGRGQPYSASVWGPHPPIIHLPFHVVTEPSLCGAGASFLASFKRWHLSECPREVREGAQRACALTGGRVFLTRLSPDLRPPGGHFLQVLPQLGCSPAGDSQRPHCPKARRVASEG